jgi:hypothetical protein
MNAPRGLFNQELKVGDNIIFLARSGTAHYMKLCKIVEIAPRYGDFKVLVESDAEEKRGEWLPTERKIIWSDTIKHVKYRNRIYNWRSAITVSDEFLADKNLDNLKNTRTKLIG